MIVHFSNSVSCFGWISCIKTNCECATSVFELFFLSSLDSRYDSRYINLYVTKLHFLQLPKRPLRACLKWQKVALEGLIGSCCGLL